MFFSSQLDKQAFIDLALDHDQARKSNLAIIITDLEQDKGDVNRIVQKLATYIQRPNAAIGIIGIKSTFNGTVYNIDNSSFRHSKERPFYLLAIGDEAEVASLIDKLKAKFNKSSQSLVFQRQISGDDLAYLRLPGEKFEKLRGKLSLPQSLQQDIRIEKGDQPIELLEIDKRTQETLDLSYQLTVPDRAEKTVPIIAIDRIQVTQTLFYDPKTKKMEPSTAANQSFQFKMSQQGNDATVSVAINAQNLPVGMYYITADLPITGLTAPKSWQSWHQDINKPRNEDGSKTLGLLDFIDSLGNKISEEQKIAGRLCFAIQRN
jgi:hypothetical protein